MRIALHVPARSSDHDSNVLCRTGEEIRKKSVSASCPHCTRPLEEQQLDTLSFRCCRGCKGMLLLHRDLIDVLEKSWHAISRETAKTTAFRTTEGWQSEPKFPCPDCRQTMEKYGYMGIAAIQI